MAMTIQELREKRAKVWDTARDFLDSKRNANGVLSEEDSKTYDAMEKTIVDLGKEIQRLERQAEIEAEMNKPTSTPVLGKPATPDVTEKTGTASDTYKTAFWNSIRNRNWIDVNNDLHIGTDAEGGYLVPDEFERKLVEALEEESIFRQMATVIKTSNGDRKIPIVTSKGEAVWMDEEQQYTLSDDTFGQASLSAYKLGTAIKISEELLNDSVFDLPSYIAREFARRIGAKEEEAFFVVFRSFFRFLCKFWLSCRFLPDYLTAYFARYISGYYLFNDGFNNKGAKRIVLPHTRFTFVSRVNPYSCSLKRKPSFRRNDKP